MVSVRNDREEDLEVVRGMPLAVAVDTVSELSELATLSLIHI